MYYINRAWEGSIILDTAYMASLMRRILNDRVLNMVIVLKTSAMYTPYMITPCKTHSFRASPDSTDPRTAAVIE